MRLSGDARPQCGGLPGASDTFKATASAMAGVLHPLAQLDARDSGPYSWAGAAVALPTTSPLLPSLMASNRKKATPAAKKKRLQFHYIKSNLFRSIHVDGAFGGVTPTQAIHMAVYSERLPIPRSTIHEVAEDGGSLIEVREEREARSGLVREMEVDLVMGLDEAVAIHKWLGEKIKEAALMKAKISEHAGGS